MAEKIRIKLNRRGVRELLNSPGAQRDLTSRAKRIARAAGEGMVVAEAEPGRNRARAAVITGTWEAMHAEATNHALTRAIGAGRG